MIITICASTVFSPQIIEVKAALKKLSHKVYIPYFTQKILDGDLDYQTYVSAKNAYGDITLREAEKVDFIKRYWDFIRDSDAVLVLNISKNGIENYIGGSTLMEMGKRFISTIPFLNAVKKCIILMRSMICIPQLSMAT